ncbi:UNVERIFIED_CONTAM: hypothetical protein Sradi_1279700 [Sesamum radiatum]|uniref:Uncharacterized protein n=1 Tax=Sesamum radiatum TaxID=300843 RepID=A0AAW2UP61_SESRA
MSGVKPAHNGHQYWFLLLKGKSPRLLSVHEPIRSSEQMKLSSKLYPMKEPILWTSATAVAYVEGGSYMDFHVLMLWQLSFLAGRNVHRFAESCFTVATYRNTYSQTIHPVPDKMLWREMSGGPEGEDSTEDIIVNPPKSLRPPGQPRKRRTQTGDRGQAKRVVHCSRCYQTGHFRTTCATPI